MISGKCGMNLTWSFDGNTLRINGTGDMMFYVPTQYPWYAWNKSIEKILIKDDVTSIGNFAFINCRNLTDIVIPDSIATIGAKAFKNCTSLINVTIPHGVTRIGSCAFQSCVSLMNITIPDNVTRIGDWIFDDCVNLKEIHYRAGSGFEKVLSEGNNAQLVSYIKSPRNQAESQPVSEQLRWTFTFKTLTVGGVSEIKNYSREKTPWGNLLDDIQRVVIEDGVEKICAKAFAKCTHLEQATIPASVKSIGNLAFKFCYCGDRKINGGKNVIWSLNNCVLMIKKNPAVKSESNFATGYETWEIVEKNIKKIKIERGIIPGKRFFDWLARMNKDIKVSF